MRVLYIASASHSGSTILSKYICKSQGYLSLGEIHLTWLKFLSQKEVLSNEVCSCGQTAMKCDFWSKVLFSWDECADINAAYTSLLKFCEDEYKEYQIIDSSKYIKGLKIWENRENVDLRIIHLIKDVRNYTVSQIDNALKKGVKRRFPGFRHLYFWWLQHKKIFKYLQDNSLKNILLNYDRWAIEPSLNFLQENANISSDSIHHILTGNNSRMTEDINKIVYDYRWFFRNEWFMAYLVLVPIRKFNIKMLKNVSS